MSLELYFAHQRAVQTIHGIAIRYRLALIGPRIDVAHSELDPALPEHSIRIRAGDDELLIDSADWVGRRAELDAHDLVWLLEHVDLRAARPRPAALRYEEAWMVEGGGPRPAVSTIAPLHCRPGVSMDRDSLIKYINATIASGDAQSSALDYDVEAIADELEQQAGPGTGEKVEAPVFWATIQKHKKNA